MSIISSAMQIYNAVSSPNQVTKKEGSAQPKDRYAPHINTYTQQGGNGPTSYNAAAFVSLRLSGTESYNIDIDRVAQFPGGKIEELGPVRLLSIEDRQSGSSISVWPETRNGTIIPSIILSDKNGKAILRLRLDMADINRRVDWFVSQGVDREKAFTEILKKELDGIDTKEALKVIDKVIKILTVVTDDAKRAEAFRFEYGNREGAEAEKQCGIFFSTNKEHLIALKNSLANYTRIIKLTLPSQ